jgi:hypothetical protein
MHRGVDLISDALPFGRLWYGDANAVANAIGYAQFYSRAYHAVIFASLWPIFARSQRQGSNLERNLEFFAAYRGRAKDGSARRRP